MCTGIRLMADNGAIVFARTLEFGIDTKSNIIMVPRDQEITGSTQARDITGLKWKSKYAVIGANILNINGIVDGVNEQGLSGGLFYFPGFAKYQDAFADQLKNSIAPWELMTWILTNFSTVQEVKDNLPNIKVLNIVFGPWGIVPPIHGIIHDLSGQSLVIEYVDGELLLHDNPIGIITNAPTFDWQLTNLSNYINLAPSNVENLKLKGITLHPLGQGSGMLGLPGDFTSPSRFVRATIFMQTLVNVKTEDNALHSAFHILNLFDIPFGSVVEKGNNQPSYELTQWTSASDLKNKRYYWHTYENRQIQMVDLMKMDLDAKFPILIPMHTKQLIADVTLA